MNRLEYELSVKVAELIQAQKNRCWYNARDALIRLPGLFLLAWYTEGWLLQPEEHEIQVIEHGWVEFNDGRIVDPSIVLLTNRTQSLSYFAGFHLGWSPVLQIPQDTSLPLVRLISHREDGLDYPSYGKAYEAALAQADQLAKALGKPVRIYPRETTVVIWNKAGNLAIILQK